MDSIPSIFPSLNSMEVQRASLISPLRRKPSNLIGKFYLYEGLEGVKDENPIIMVKESKSKVSNFHSTPSSKTTRLCKKVSFFSSGKSVNHKDVELKLNSPKLSQSLEKSKNDVTSVLKSKKSPKLERKKSAIPSFHVKEDAFDQIYRLEMVEINKLVSQLKLKRENEFESVGIPGPLVNADIIRAKKILSEQKKQTTLPENDAVKRKPEKGDKEKMKSYNMIPKLMDLKEELTKLKERNNIESDNSVDIKNISNFSDRSKGENSKENKEFLEGFNKKQKEGMPKIFKDSSGKELIGIKGGLGDYKLQGLANSSSKISLNNSISKKKPVFAVRNTEYDYLVKKLNLKENYFSAFDVKRLAYEDKIKKLDYLDDNVSIQDENEIFDGLIVGIEKFKGYSPKMFKYSKNKEEDNKTKSNNDETKRNKTSTNFFMKNFSKQNTFMQKLNYNKKSLESRNFVHLNELLSDQDHAMIRSCKISERVGELHKIEGITSPTLAHTKSDFRMTKNCFSTKNSDGFFNNVYSKNKYYSSGKTQASLYSLSKKSDLRTARIKCKDLSPEGSNSKENKENVIIRGEKSQHLLNNKVVHKSTEKPVHKNYKLKIMENKRKIIKEKLNFNIHSEFEKYNDIQKFMVSKLDRIRSNVKSLEIHSKPYQ